MKTILNPRNASSDAPASAGARYQIYTQTRSGVFMPNFKSDSAVAAVEAFLKQAPMIAGGEIRLWNHRTHEMGASVEWRNAKTDFGFSVPQRTNLFYDRWLGMVARQIQEREAIRAEVRQEAGLTVAV